MKQRFRFFSYRFSGMKIVSVGIQYIHRGGNPYWRLNICIWNRNFGMEW